MLFTPQSKFPSYYPKVATPSSLPPQPKPNIKNTSITQDFMEMVPCCFAPLIKGLEQRSHNNPQRKQRTKRARREWVGVRGAGAYARSTPEVFLTARKKTQIKNPPNKKRVRREFDKAKEMITDKRGRIKGLRNDPPARKTIGKKQL